MQRRELEEKDLACVRPFALQVRFDDCHDERCSVALGKSFCAACVCVCVCVCGCSHAFVLFSLSADASEEKISLAPVMRRGGGWEVVVVYIGQRVAFREGGRKEETALGR